MLLIVASRDHDSARQRGRRRWSVSAGWLIGLLCATVLSAAPVHAGVMTELASDGEARMPIVIGPNADQTVAAAAEDLATYLAKISNATFEVTVGDGSHGIVVGLPGNFTNPTIEQTFGDTPFERDHYRLVSTGDALYLLGATPEAAEFAVWDLLHQFGYRLYFPSPQWEIVPEQNELAIAVNRLERPSYYNRNAPRGGMRMNLRPWLATEKWQQWRTWNRISPSFDIQTGHMYSALIRRHRERFDANPEFYAKVDGERAFRGGSTKICIGNERLRELVVADAINQIEANPERDSISLDPSDGSNWCSEDCKLCIPLGSVSDRVVVLSNQVADALEARFDRTYFVGIYAYNDYSPPPTIDVHPNVIVSLATAFIRGGQTFDEMLKGWSARTELLGIREYYGVPMWDSSMPGRARAGSLDYLERTIREHHRAGARFVNAENDHAWGPNGLGYYLASRLLWNVETSVDEVVDDFLARAFGQVKEPMREFYEMITGRPLPSDHMVGMMYRLLGESRAQANDPHVIQRIDELVIYTRYVDLQRRWQAAAGRGKQTAFDELIKHIWRSRTHIMTDSHGLFYYLNRQQRSNDEFSWTPGERESLSEPPERLRERGNEPFSESEILAYLKEGIERHDIVDFEQVSFSDELVPAAERLGWPDVEAALPTERRSRGRRTYYTWIDQPPHILRFKMTNGLITHYRDRGDATIELCPVNEPFSEAVAIAHVPPDDETREIVMHSEYEGLHRIEINDGLDSSRLAWEPGIPMTLEQRFDRNHMDDGEQVLYFYVPRGTEMVGGYANQLHGALIASNGETVYTFDNEMGYFQASVPDGEDGKL